jgi:hypothetical protein
MSRMKKLLDKRTRPSSVNVCTLVGLRIVTGTLYPAMIAMLTSRLNASGAAT